MLISVAIEISRQYFTYTAPPPPYLNSTRAAPEHRVIFMYPYKLCGEKALIETKPQ
jgi:hypothetical protein